MGTRKGYALITGGTSGIGYELAKRCAQENYDLILVARSEDRLQEVATEMKDFNVDVQTIDLDLYEPDAAFRLYDEVKGRGLKVELLANNAGVGLYGKFVENALEEHARTVQINVNALMNITHLFLKDMLERASGKILQVGSIYSKMPAPFMAVYAAAKAFVQSFTHALIQELEDTGVSMTLLLPGATDTDFFHKAGFEGAKAYAENDVYDPKEVANEGFEALMQGKAVVIPGLMNKIEGFMADMMPEPLNAKIAKKQNRPSEKPEDKRRTEPGHEPSRKERDRLNDQ